jgi:hypothetical protein
LSSIIPSFNVFAVCRQRGIRIILHGIAMQDVYCATASAAHAASVAQQRQWRAKVGAGGTA